MAQQNFIAKALCSLGGDKYTQASTETSLQTALHEAQKNIVPFDIQKDKWILLSDLHKGAKNRADDFRLCEANYVTALNHYFEAGYRLCVMGDAEELWEEFPVTVLRQNSATFHAERKFHEAGRYRRIWGNHDEIWGDPALVRKTLQPLYGANPLTVPEAILLDVRDGNEMIGQIFLAHGHQGTQNEGESTKFSKWIPHNIWRPLQVLTGFSCNTPATDWRIRNDRDKIIYQWATRHPKLVLIAGHTHAPVFESYSHRARLIAEISSIRLNWGNLAQDQQTAGLKRIEKLTSDLEKVEDKLSADEKNATQPLEYPLPCYFNTGCCCFADGDITGIEMSEGEIRLVRWPDDDGHAHKILQTGKLKDIFRTLN